MAFKSLLDPSFEYRNSSTTDIRKTFDRVRREIKKHHELRQNENVIAAVLGDSGAQSRDRSQPGR